jgi:cation diffusion facilitator family transporter
MPDCCSDKQCELEVLRASQSRTLETVLAINAVMFLVEVGAGLLSGSTALLADSLDNLGDALTYSLSLYAIARSPRTKALVALFKGGLILTAALFVLGQLAYHIVVPVMPGFETMGVVGFVALAANGICFALLWRHRSDDVNMSSVWECSRNDIACNLAVLVAALGVWATQSRWPDLAVGAALALLLLVSAYRVVRDAWTALRPGLAQWRTTASRAR